MPESRLAELTQDVGAGGRWKPSTCLARQRLAVIIPHRDRAAHLRLLLFYLHPFLQRQMRHYQIFVVEQVGGGMSILRHCQYSDIVNTTTLSTPRYCQYYDIVNIATFSIPRHCRYRDIVNTAALSIPRHCQYRCIVNVATLQIPRQCQ